MSFISSVVFLLIMVVYVASDQSDSSIDGVCCQRNNYNRDCRRQKCSGLDEVCYELHTKGGKLEAGCSISTGINCIGSEYCRYECFPTVPADEVLSDERKDYCNVHRDAFDIANGRALPYKEPPIKTRTEYVSVMMTTQGQPITEPSTVSRDKHVSVSAQVSEKSTTPGPENGDEYYNESMPFVGGEIRRSQASSDGPVFMITIFTAAAVLAMAFTLSSDYVQ